MRFHGLPRRQQSLERRAHNIIEQKGTVNEQRKASDLQPLEILPAEGQRDEPDEERAAGVDGAA